MPVCDLATCRRATGLHYMNVGHNESFSINNVLIEKHFDIHVVTMSVLVVYYFSTTKYLILENPMNTTETTRELPLH